MLSLIFVCDITNSSVQQTAHSVSKAAAVLQHSDHNQAPDVDTFVWSHNGPAQTLHPSVGIQLQVGSS